MSDAHTPLETLKAEILAFAKERDWEQFHSPKNLSMALSAEASELLEHFLWIDGADSLGHAQSPERMAAIREELADVIIYALEFANVAGIDVTSAIREKMQLNAQKYPVEKARGRSAKYTEL